MGITTGTVRRARPAGRTAALIAAAAMVLGLVSAVPSHAALPSAAPDGAHRLLLGATPAGGGNTRWNGLTTLETTIGRQLDFVRVFEVWDAAYPTTFHSNLTGSDRIMALSVRARRADGTVVPWADIATMQPGSQLDQELQTWIARMKAIGKPVWFGFTHEPETAPNAANGTATDYIAAWRRIVGEFRAAGATNVRFIWIVTGNAYEVATTDPRYAGTWYPGDDYVDLISADVYNWSSCRPTANTAWRSFDTLTTNLRAFAAQHPTKEVVLSELGSAEQGGDKGAWIDDAAALLKQPAFDQFAGIGWFDKADTTYPDCQFQISSSSAATAAFTRLAQDPFFGGATDPGAPSVTLTSPADGATVAGDVTVSATATPGTMPLTGVTFAVDGTTIGTDTDGSDGWSTTWDTATASEGPAAVSAVATDRWGLSDTDSAGVVVDNLPPVPPTLALTAPADGATVAGTVPVAAQVQAGDAAVTGVTFKVGATTIGTDTDGSNGWATTWDTATTPDGPATVTAVATDSGGLSATDSSSVTVLNAPPAPVASLVVKSPSALTAGEAAVRARLAGLGYDVRVRDDDTVAASAVAGSAFVIVGYSVTQTRVATALRGVALPVWVAKPTLFDDFRLTRAATSSSGTSTATTLAVEAPGNAMAGGRSGSVRFLTSRDAVSWGKPGSGARVVATVGGKAALFVYRAGRTLANGNAAPGCRLSFPLAATAPTRHSADGWAMFDATTAYAAGGC